MKDQEHRPKDDIKIERIEQIKKMFNAEAFSKEVLFNHWRGLIMIAIVAISAISLRYSCEKKLAKIERLNRELLDKRFEALTRSSELIGISRPSQVKKLINEKGIEIEESDKPAYILND